MSYPMDLDEYTTERLVEELKRRSTLLSEGNCTYCGKNAQDTKPCRLIYCHEEAQTQQLDAEKVLHEHCDKKNMDVGARVVAATVFIQHHNLAPAFKEWLKRYA